MIRWPKRGAEERICRRAVTARLRRATVCVCCLLNSFVFGVVRERIKERDGKNKRQEYMREAVRGEMRL